MNSPLAWLRMYGLVSGPTSFMITGVSEFPLLEAMPAPPDDAAETAGLTNGMIRPPPVARTMLPLDFSSGSYSNGYSAIREIRNSTAPVPKFGALNELTSAWKVNSRPSSSAKLIVLSCRTPFTSRLSRQAAPRADLAALTAAAPLFFNAPERLTPRIPYRVDATKPPSDPGFTALAMRRSGSSRPSAASNQ